MKLASDLVQEQSGCDVTPDPSMILRLSPARRRGRTLPEFPNPVGKLGRRTGNTLSPEGLPSLTNK